MVIAGSNSSNDILRPRASNNSDSLTLNGQNSYPLLLIVNELISSFQKVKTQSVAHFSQIIVTDRIFCLALSSKHRYRKCSFIIFSVQSKYDPPKLCRVLKIY